MIASMDERKTCLCDTALCAKCLSVNCRDKNCSVHTKNQKMRYRENWERANGKEFPAPPNF